MAPSRVGNVAVRPALGVELTLPAGSENAWGMMDSPTLGRAAQVSRPGGYAPRNPQASSSSSKLKPVAPLNIKKMRRRGLLSGMYLALPASPLSPLYPSTPGRTPGTGASGQTPQTAFTFTAEWDSNEKEFMFSPVGDIPRSAASCKALFSPVPNDIEEELPTEAAPHRCSVYEHPSRASSCSSSSSLVSHPGSLFMHERKPSVTSTAPSSVAPDCEEVEEDRRWILQMSREVFREDLRRATSMCDGDLFDCAVLEEMDDELLSRPWDSFIAVCHSSAAGETHSHTQRAPPPPPPLLCYAREKALPDVPVPVNYRPLRSTSMSDDEMGRKSWFETDAEDHHPSLHCVRRLRSQISRTFLGGHR